MDLCHFCKRYHPSHQVCDGYIEWLKKKVAIKPKDLKGGPTKATQIVNGTRENE
jgi:hypothetical protein